MTRPNISFEKIAAQIERDVAQIARNQVAIDKMKSLTLKGKLMVFAERHPTSIPAAFGFIAAVMVILVCTVARVRADDIPHAQCPTAGEPCKILILSQQEERMLMGPNGILDTAAQARALDLGQFVVYLKTRIANAPAGTVQPLPETKPETTAPVDNTKK
jgi:hypothetical protein